GLELVTGSAPDIELRAGRAGFHDGIESVGFGRPELAGFFPDAQGIGIVNPLQLSWQEPGALGKNVFGADRCRWVPLGAVRCLNREIVAAAYSGGCRTLIPISVGQRSDFGRTLFRFISDSVPG